jgi:hypothetical protein
VILVLGIKRFGKHIDARSAVSFFQNLSYSGWIIKWAKTCQNNLSMCSFLILIRECTRFQPILLKTCMENMYKYSQVNIDNLRHFNVHFDTFVAWLVPEALAKCLNSMEIIDIYTYLALSGSKMLFFECANHHKKIMNHGVTLPRQEK